LPLRHGPVLLAVAALLSIGLAFLLRWKFLAAQDSSPRSALTALGPGTTRLLSDGLWRMARLISMEIRSDNRRLGIIGPALEFVCGAHRKKIAGRTRKRRVGQDASISILPSEGHIPPDVISEGRVKQPSIIPSRTGDVFDLSVPQQASCEPLRRNLIARLQ
jgi:hypothetical protein